MNKSLVSFHVGQEIILDEARVREGVTQRCN